MLDEFGQTEADWNIKLGAGEKSLKRLEVKDPF